jgi:hypothetical protein
MIFQKKLKRNYMKKIYLLSILIFGLFNVYSQTQITLTFLGKDSISQNPVSLDSVYVKNLTENCDTLLYGPAPVLSLLASWPVGIDETAANSLEAFILKQNYPNPFQRSTNVSIYREYQGPLNLMLFDGLGIKLAEYHNEFEKGSYSFVISSSGNKILILIVSDDKNHRSIKIVSTGQGNESNTIRYLGLAHPFEKSLSFNPENPGFIFYLGNQMMYTAYTSGYHDNTIFDNPTSSTTYTFNMILLSNPVIPTVTTAAVTNITQTTATSGGTVTSDGGATVTARGVCWSTSSNPTTADSHTSDGSGTGTFISNLNGLTANTLYYVRAYATNSVGTAYGNEVTFSTLPNPVLPTVTTTAVTNIAQTTATSGGDVTSDGGTTVTARGVCWDTSSNPTTANSHTTDGSGTGTFVSNLTGLTPNTLYYVRAYATNSLGTAYGNEVSFTTLQTGAHYIGESFGGGIIFYIDGTGQHGLISATSDQGTGVQWGCYGTLIGGTSTAIGTEQANTTAIVNGCSTPGIAAQICDVLVLNGYSDWFLPSKDELNQMYIQKTVIGGFSAYDYYWSSSEYDATTAWNQHFGDGYQSNTHTKIYPARVRAIRAF